MTNNIDSLKSEIENLRSKLNFLYSESDSQKNSVLKLSQELDELILKLQKSWYK